MTKRVLFCGRKNLALIGLDYLLEQGWEVLPVVGRRSEAPWMERPSFAQGLVARGLPGVSQRDLLSALAGNDAPSVVRCFLEKPVDLVISYLFPDRIQPPLLRLPKIAAVNLHPGPLPEYGGLGGYSFAILERAKQYGVTAHHMDESFDTGDIIHQASFACDPGKVTALELERMTRPYLFTVFREIIDLIVRGEPLPATPQGFTRYVNKDEREAAKLIDLELDDASTIDRKSRAFWYPPYNGACVLVDGQEFTVVPDQELEGIGRLVHAQKPGAGPGLEDAPSVAASGTTDDTPVGPQPAENHTVRRTVSEVINHILVDTGRERLDLGDDDVLMTGIGLDSLDLAVMTVSLERELSVDPFREGRRAARTFGELVGIYEEVLGK